MGTRTPSTSRTETSFNLTSLIAALGSAPHGDLQAYVSIAGQALAYDPHFYARLISWNLLKGTTRDSRIALPVIALSQRAFGLQNPDFTEHALAMLAQENARGLWKAWNFNRDLKGPTRLVNRLIVRWLTNLEQRGYAAWERVALQHRASLASLYTVTHTTPATLAMRAALGLVRQERRAEGLKENVALQGKFRVLADLRTQAPARVAGLIKEHKFPFLLLRGALGDKLKDPIILQMVIDQMTPNEITSNMQGLMRLGVKDDPALRATLDLALGKVGTSRARTTNVLKATVAAEALDAVDPAIAAKLRAAQEAAVTVNKTIDGHWGVVADISGSMHTAIDTARLVASAITSMMREGTVRLVFVNNQAWGADVTGKTYEEIGALTKGMRAGGGTDLGRALYWLTLPTSLSLPLDGVILISDGADHGGAFVPLVHRMNQTRPSPVALYFLELDGEPDKVRPACAQFHVPIEHYNLRGQPIDYTSILTLAQTFRVNTFSLMDEIRAFPLITLNEVLTHTRGIAVLAR